MQKTNQKHTHTHTCQWKINFGTSDSEEKLFKPWKKLLLCFALLLNSRVIQCCVDFLLDFGCWDMVCFIFLQAVMKRLMTDVPFGVLLSGGLDSSLVAAVASRQLAQTEAANIWGAQLHTFSVGLKVLLL
jgi:hypothetical protein